MGRTLKKAYAVVLICIMSSLTITVRAEDNKLDVSKDVESSYIPLTELKESDVQLNIQGTQTQKKDTAEYRRSENLMKQANAAENDNSDPNGAYYLPFNEAVGDKIDTTGTNKWYGVIADRACRITTLMSAGDASADFDLYVYKLDESTGVLSNIGYSCQAPGKNEVVDLIVAGGTYYIQINAHTGTGNFGLISYQSSDYIANEINDTISSATVMKESGTLSDAVDSPMDMDVYKFSITSEASRKKFTLTNPANCNYALYIVKSDNTIYSISSGTTYLLDAGDYYLVVTTADGTYSSKNPYTLDVTNQNCVRNARDLVSYNGYLLQQAGTTGLNYYINGKPIDFSYNYKYDISAGADYLHATMTLSTKSTSEVFNKYFKDTNGVNHEGIMFIKYNSSFNESGRDLALYIPINDVYYSYHRTASSSLPPTSVHQSGSVFAQVIVDVNTGKVIDLFSPNWYYESGASHHTHNIGTIYKICEID